jgi:hypothetical protein
MGSTESRHTNSETKDDEYIPISQKENKNPLEKCNQDKFQETGNIDELKDCYYMFPDINPIKIPNPLDPTSEETCYLINNKKLDYYIHKYEPQKVIDNIRNFDISEQIKNNYLEKLSEIADLTPKDNCCNCISFVFYIIYDNNVFENWNNNKFDYTIIQYLQKIHNYLLSLHISVVNINKCLPDFISRIYLDISVLRVLFESKKIIDKYIFKNKRLENLFNKNIEIIEFFFTNRTTEIYTIISKNPIHQTRSYRFLTMIEPDVNIKIFREADGYVTYMDCMNIQNFVNANTLMLVYNINTDVDNFITLDSLDKIKEIKNDFKPIELYSKRYSEWLNKEEKWLNKFVYTNITGFDLLAGLFSLSIQIKKEKYISISNILREDLIRNDFPFITFDERLLYRLFINIISIPKVFSDEFPQSHIFFIKTQEDLNMIEFFLHNFSYVNSAEYFEIPKILLRNPNDLSSFYKDETFYNKNSNIFNDILLKLEDNIIENREVKQQIKNYYNHLDTYLELKNIKYDYTGNNDRQYTFFLILTDILFQNNIIKNDENKILPIIKLSVPHSEKPINTSSLHLLNSFMFDYEDLVNYVYIDRPLNIMSDKVLAMYRGGYYHKYLKYAKKLN